MNCSVCKERIQQPVDGIVLQDGKSEAHTACVGCNLCSQTLAVPANQIAMLPNGAFVHGDRDLCIVMLGKAISALQGATSNPGVAWLAQRRAGAK